MRPLAPAIAASIVALAAVLGASSPASAGEPSPAVVDRDAATRIDTAAQPSRAVTESVRATVADIRNGDEPVRQDAAGQDGERVVPSTLDRVAARCSAADIAARVAAAVAIDVACVRSDRCRFAPGPQGVPDCRLGRLR